jgi:hypothetical protein
VGSAVLQALHDQSLKAALLDLERWGAIGHRSLLGKRERGEKKRSDVIDRSPLLDTLIVSAHAHTLHVETWTWTTSTTNMSLGRLNTKGSVLLICDIQERFRDIIWKFDSVVKTSKFLVDGFNALDAQVVATEQYPKALGVTVKELTSSEKMYVMFVI